jgi:hypothetical protein
VSGTCYRLSRSGSACSPACSRSRPAARPRPAPRSPARAYPVAAPRCAAEIPAPALPAPVDLGPGLLSRLAPSLSGRRSPPGLRSDRLRASLPAQTGSGRPQILPAALSGSQRLTARPACGPVGSWPARAGGSDSGLFSACSLAVFTGSARIRPGPAPGGSRFRRSGESGCSGPDHA